MEWSEKINNKKYFAGTIVAILLAVLGGKGFQLESLLLSLVVLASVINQWLMFVILGKLLKRMTTQLYKVSWFEQFVLWGQIFLKFALLGAVFYYLITHARHIVAHGLILYTFQLIILVLSIKNIGALIKKGPHE